MTVIILLLPLSNSSFVSELTQFYVRGLLHLKYPIKFLFRK